LTRHAYAEVSMQFTPDLRRLLLAALPMLVLAGCSIREMAVDMVADSLTSGGGDDVFASDDDPALIREALPFGLKTYEGLAAASPRNTGLLLATGKGFVVYAYLLQLEADKLEDLEQARAQRVRASRLFLRGRDYALRGLAVTYPAVVEGLRRDAPAVLATMKKSDVPLLYWAAAGWAAALGANKTDLELVAELPIAGALASRALELDESFDSGALHEFFITYEGTRPGGNPAEARRHYQRALELSRATRASAHVALAEAVTIREQNLGEFRSLIAAALAVDVNAAKELRLSNTLAQDRARWLDQRRAELFVEE
jgi:hypothetical protein